MNRSTVYFLRPFFHHFIRSTSKSSSMALAPILTLEKLQNADAGILLLRMKREKTRNAISFHFVDLLTQFVKEINKNAANYRALIVKSDLKGMFCSGADLKERSTMSEEETEKYVARLRMLFQDVYELPIPTIAAIDGAALGGGLELALACDIRVASTDSKMGLVETKWAIIPGAGGTQRLSRIVGPSVAKEMMFTARVMNGSEALNVGLINHLEEQNQNGNSAFLKSLNLARQISSQGPVAVRTVKIAVNTGLGMDLHSALDFERTAYRKILPTKDRLEGLRAFKEKRSPNYVGA